MMAKIMAGVNSGGLYNTWGMISMDRTDSVALPLFFLLPFSSPISFPLFLSFPFDMYRNTHTHTHTRMHEHTHTSADKRYDEQEVDRHTTGQRKMPTT